MSEQDFVEYEVLGDGTRRRKIAFRVECSYCGDYHVDSTGNTVPAGEVDENSTVIKEYAAVLKLRHPDGVTGRWVCQACWIRLLDIAFAVHQHTEYGAMSSPRNIR